MFPKNVSQDVVTQFQITGGIQRYHKKNQGPNPMYSPSAVQLMKAVLIPTDKQRDAMGAVGVTLEEGIAEAIGWRKKNLGKGGWTTLSRCFKDYPEVWPSTLALVIIRAILSRVMLGDKKRQGVTAISNYVADVVYALVLTQHIKNEMPEEFERAVQEAKDAVGRKGKQRELEKKFFRETKQKIPYLWTKHDFINVGSAFIDLVITYTGLIQRESIKRSNGHFSKVITLTDDARHWLRKADERLSLLHPLLLPMVRRPYRWMGPFKGGYPNALGWRQQLIKRKDADFFDEMHARYEKLQPVYNAINLVQDTGWKTNAEVLDVISYLWEHRPELSCFAETHVKQVKPLADVLRSLYEDPEASNADKAILYKQMDEVERENCAADSKAIIINQVLGVARQFKLQDSFYFPHQLDFRGRMYPLPPFLSPQGTDLSKAVLKFNTGKPLGELGSMWLAVHLANTFGKDKITLDERMLWVEFNTDAILEVAEDPYNNLWWLEAEEPFQFLAGCLEWKGYIEEGFDYVCSLPISVDGSCNGLQHFSAMTRSVEGGRSVNLLPSDKPQDAYSDVQAVALDINERHCTGADPTKRRFAEYCRENDIITRKLCKQPTMTLAYGVTTWGIVDQVGDVIKKRVAKGELPGIPEDTHFRGLKAYCAEVVTEALDTAVKGAKEAMDWLAEVAGVLVDNGVPIEWEVPTGFWVKQEYYRSRGKRFDFTQPSGVREQLTIRVYNKDSPLRKKSVQGMAPNFVHSIDAAHMMMSFNKASERGVTHFHAIHDSYGTHACDMPALADSLREAFVELHQESQLEEYYKHLQATLPEEVSEKLPALPEFGTLDINCVMESDYFFA